MKLCRKVLVSLGAVVLMSNALAQTSEASQLSAARQKATQLQNQITETKTKMVQQEQQIGTATNQVNHSRAQIKSLTSKITENTSQTQRILVDMKVLSSKIHKNQTALKQNQARLEQIVRGTYEDGQVPYLSVLLGSTSFSDLLSRMETLSMVTKSENDLLRQTQALQKTLKTEQDTQNKDYQQLAQKGRELYNLKQQTLREEAQERYSLMATRHKVAVLSKQQQDLATKLHMTQGEIQMLEADAQQQERILSSRSGSSSVVIPALRYQNISPAKLYEFVKKNGSAFSLSDIETICNAARSYNVNPALMLAITGQELDFVQNGTPNENEKLVNPFDVFGSWALYHTTLAQSAAYAAQMLQVKLSVSPPAGEDAILWINDPANHAGSGVYATDPNWAYGVRTFFNDIETYVSSS